MKRIAIDMDEVLADTLGEHMARYNRDHDDFQILEEVLEPQIAFQALLTSGSF